MYVSPYDVLRFFEDNHSKISLNDAKLLTRMLTQRKDELVTKSDLEQYLLPQTNQTLRDRLKYRSS